MFAEPTDNRIQAHGVLLEGLDARQTDVVRSNAERLLVLGAAGTGKTEAIVRRVAWDVATRAVTRRRIIALAFTERAAAELRARVRERLAWIAGGDCAAAFGESDCESALGGMYVGTIHAFCLALLRELAPKVYVDYQLLDEGARDVFVQLHWQKLEGVERDEDIQTSLRNMGLMPYQRDRFVCSYDLLNEYDQLHVRLSSSPAPPPGSAQELAWCLRAGLRKSLGEGTGCFGRTTARYYALLRARHVLDYATLQTELLRLIERDAAVRQRLGELIAHVVVDDAQDLSPVQRRLIAALAGREGRLTAAADPRQAVFAWRGGDAADLRGLRAEFAPAVGAEVLELQENRRSTSPIVALVRRWSQTIAPPVGPPAAAGEHTNTGPGEVALVSFAERPREAEWIARKVAWLLDGEGDGAQERGGRSLRPADVAILLRALHEAPTYAEELRRQGIPTVLRDQNDFADPDLFEQPEVQLCVGALARVVGIEDDDPLSDGIGDLFGDRHPVPDVEAAAARLRQSPLPIAPDLGARLVLAAELLGARLLRGTAPAEAQLDELRSPATRALLTQGPPPGGVRLRVILDCLLEEAGLAQLDTDGPASKVHAHISALARIVGALELPGLAVPGDLRAQVHTLCIWSKDGVYVQSAAQPAQREAVVLTTIHTAKGGEWPAVFVADVCAGRFPSRRAREVPELLFKGPPARVIDTTKLADDDDFNGERRVMYLALTRAQRYLFVSCSGTHCSRFRRDLEPMVRDVGGTTCHEPEMPPAAP